MKGEFFSLFFVVLSYSQRGGVELNLIGWFFFRLVAC